VPRSMPTPTMDTATTTISNLHHASCMDQKQCDVGQVDSEAKQHIVCRPGSGCNNSSLWQATRGDNSFYNRRSFPVTPFVRCSLQRDPEGPIQPHVNPGTPFVVVTLRPLRGPANTMRAQGPKPCPSNAT
jgi:hypothetical protein